MEIKSKMSLLEEDKEKMTQENQNLNKQLRMKEIQIVLSQEMKNKTLETLEEGEIAKSVEIKESNLSESELQAVLLEYERNLKR